MKNANFAVRMEEKKLYPMRFCTLQDDYSWGTEAFKIADLGYRDSLVRDGWLAGNAISEIMDMYVDQVVGENVFEYWGRQFPVCIRQIKVNGRMPLRVSPDDEHAQQRWDFLGKEKLWYVLRCGTDARLFLGFLNDTDAGEVYSKCSDGSIAEILNVVAPYAGQVLHIPAGTAHAALGDMDILEIAESSPLDFCMCSWGDDVSEDEFDPSLDFVDVLDLVDYRRFRQSVAPEVCNGPAEKLFSSTQFEVARLNLVNPVHVSGGDSAAFALYSCISGAASVQADIDGEKKVFGFSKGETILVPADCSDFYLVPAEVGTVLVETTVPKREDKDTYINPDMS